MRKSNIITSAVVILVVTVMTACGGQKPATTPETAAETTTAVHTTNISETAILTEAETTISETTFDTMKAANEAATVSETTENDTVPADSSTADISDTTENDNDYNDYNKLKEQITGKWETVSFTDWNGNTKDYDLTDPVHRSYYIGLSIDPMAQTGLIIGTVGHPAGESYNGNRIEVSTAVLNTTTSRQFEINDDLQTMKVNVIADGSITATMKRVDEFSIDKFRNTNDGIKAEDYFGNWCYANLYVSISPVENDDSDYEGATGDYHVFVKEYHGAAESTQWEYICNFVEQTGTLKCDGYAKCTDYYCDDEGNLTITSRYDDGTGYFELRDDHLYWTDYKENEGYSLELYKLSDIDT